jgi:FkbM family methyltransferase
MAMIWGVSGTRFAPIFRGCGLSTALKVAYSERFACGNYTVQPRGVAHPIQLRPRTSDSLVLVQIFGARDFEMELPFRPRSIIDAGANIGISSVYFAMTYPEARVLAIEPDAGNFALCQVNTAPYPNVQCVRAAVWSHVCMLNLANPGVASWSFQFEESAETEGSVPAMTVNDAIERNGSPEVDILKIDVEGAEKELLLHEDGWFSRTRLMILELHEHHSPGCRAALDAVLSRHPMDESAQGEKVILKRRGGG